MQTDDPRRGLSVTYASDGDTTYTMRCTIESWRCVHCSAEATERGLILHYAECPMVPPKPPWVLDVDCEAQIVSAKRGEEEV